MLKIIDPNATRDNPMYYIDLEAKTMRSVSDITIPKYCVPYDFDGKRLLY